MLRQTASQSSRNSEAYLDFMIKLDRRLKDYDVMRVVGPRRNFFTNGLVSCEMEAVSVTRRTDIDH
jgi:hypothetical protein